MIPKLIYAVWTGPYPLPKHDCYFDTWAEKLPGYKIVLLGDSDIPSSRCTREMGARGKHVSVAQYTAWSRLYETGGIYLDLDVEVLRNFDDLLSHDAFLGIENDGGGKPMWAACGVLAASPRHPFLREVLAYMDALDYDCANVENHLGPRMFTKLLMEHGWDRTDADATVAFVTLLDSKRFYPYAWGETFTPACVTDRTYAIHKWAYTWKPKVSVVIPCYNQAHLLPEAIESALSQTEPPIEVIVVDDGSKPRVKIPARYKGRVKLIRQTNRGVSAARNTGVAAAKGPNIVCLDADDKLRPRFIARLSGLSDLVSCDLETFGARTVKWCPPMSDPILGDFIRQNQLISGSVFTKAIWEKVGGYDEDMRDGLEDWDFWTRCVHAGARAHVRHETLFDYREYSAGERELNRNSWHNAASNGAESRMREKWHRLGIPAPHVPSLNYPVKLGVTISYNGQIFQKGSLIDHTTALYLKYAGLLTDSRIV